jgi:hypothetical protein
MHTPVQGLRRLGVSIPRAHIDTTLCRRYPITGEARSPSASPIPRSGHATPNKVQSISVQTGMGPWDFSVTEMHIPNPTRCRTGVPCSLQIGNRGRRSIASRAEFTCAVQEYRAMTLASVMHITETALWRRSNVHHNLRLFLHNRVWRDGAIQRVQGVRGTTAPTLRGDFPSPADPPGNP